MAHNSNLLRILKHGLALASTWGTAAVTSTLDGLYVKTISGLDRRRKLSVDKSAGQGFENAAFHGIEEAPTPNFTMDVQENDGQATLLMAVAMGSDVTTGGSDPYTHTMTAQEVSGKLLTYRWQELDECKVVPTFALDSLKLAFTGEGILEMSSSGMGDKVTDSNASTDLDSLTYAVRSGVYTLQNFEFRLNTQSGDALDSDDEAVVANFEINFGRPLNGEPVSGGDAIAQPTEGAYPEFRVSFRLPQKNALAKALESAVSAGTKYKGEAIYSGSSSSREIKVSMPQLFVESVTVPKDEVMPAEVVLRMQKAAAAPTGMDGITMPTITQKNGIATSVLA